MHAFCVITYSRFSHIKVCLTKVRQNFAFSPFRKKIYYRTVCSTKRQLDLNFTDEENEAAHRIMENNPSYAKTVCRNPKYDSSPKFTCADSSGIYRTFYEATADNLAKENQLNLDNLKFSGLVRSLSKSFHSATFEEMIHIFHCLCFWPHGEQLQGPNSKILWHMLDRECIGRLGGWTVPQKLIIADYWFHLRLSRMAKYNFTMIKDLIQKQHSLSPSELIQLVFFISIQRDVPQTLLNHLESRLITLVHVVTLKELTIICLGYFKTENAITHLHLLKGILDRVTDNMTELEPVNVVAVLKCARKSFKPHYIALYLKFIRACALNCESWDLYASVHSALLSSATYIFEPALLENAIEKFSEVVHEARLKDICKILQCLSLFNYLPHSKFNNNVFKEFLKEERAEEIRSFPKDLVYLAVFYSYMGYYDYKTLNRVFMPEIVNKVPDYEKGGFSLLDYSIDIECADYDGPRLLRPLRNQIVMKKREERENPDSNGMVMRGINLMVETLESFEGFHNNVCVRHILPHMVVPDLVIRLNPKPDALPLADILKSYSPYEIVRPPVDEVWACFVFAGIYSTAYNSKRLCGIIMMKKRQLIKLGYKVLIINSRSVPINSVHRQVLVKAKLKELCENVILSLSQ